MPLLHCSLPLPLCSHCSSHTYMELSLDTRNQSYPYFCSPAKLSLPLCLNCGFEKSTVSSLALVNSITMLFPTFIFISFSNTLSKSSTGLCSVHSFSANTHLQMGLSPRTPPLSLIFSLNFKFPALSSIFIIEPSMHIL